MGSDVVVFSFELICALSVLFVFVWKDLLLNWNRPSLLLLPLEEPAAVLDVDGVVVLLLDGDAVGDSLIELNLFSLVWKLSRLRSELELDDDDDDNDDELATWFVPNELDELVDEEHVDEEDTVDEVEPVEEVDFEFKLILFTLVVAFEMFLAWESAGWTGVKLFVLWLGGNESRVLANIIFLLFFLLLMLLLLLVIKGCFLISFRLIFLSSRVVECCCWWLFADLIGRKVYLLALTWLVSDLLLLLLFNSREEVDDDDVDDADVDDETESFVKLLRRAVSTSSSLFTSLIFSTGANMPWLCLHWKYLKPKERK